MEILTAYVRQRAHWDVDEPKDGQESTKSDENVDINYPSFYRVPADIQAIMTVLGRRYRISHTPELTIALYIDLQRTDLRRIKMRSAQLIGVDFSYSNLDYAIFDKSNLRGTFFTRAHLRNASFIDANLKEAKFLEAILDGAEFRDINMSLEDEEITAIRNKSSAAKGPGSYLLDPCADAFELWDCRGDFRGASLEGAYFNHAKLKHVLFMSANLAASKFDFARLQGAIFEDANLEGVRFYYAYLEQADFRNANCARADFTGAVLNETNFHGVKGITGGMLSNHQCANAVNLDPDLLNGI